jgi:hypothetical protein
MTTDSFLELKSFKVHKGQALIPNQIETSEWLEQLTNDSQVYFKQCRKCNRFLNGNEIQYRFGLIARYGIEFVENLESISNENRVRKYTKDELIQIKKTYDLKIKQLTNPSLSVYL